MGKSIWLLFGLDESSQAEVSPDLIKWVAIREGRKPKNWVLPPLNHEHSPRNPPLGSDVRSIWIIGPQQSQCNQYCGRTFVPQVGRCIVKTPAAPLFHRTWRPPGTHFWGTQCWIPLWAVISLTNLAQNFEYIPPLCDSQHCPWRKALKIVVIVSAPK